jgi:predicted PurR-regulated permease PerM
MTQLKLSIVQTASYALALLALVATLELKLLSALLAGMLVYQIVHLISPVIERHTSSQRARLVAVALLAAVIVGALIGLTIGIIQRVESDVPDAQKLMTQIMVLIDQTRAHIPAAVADYLPVDVDQMKARVVALMHEHANQLSQGGKSAARIFGHIVIGTLIGAIVAVSTRKNTSQRPLIAALRARIACFADAFHRIVFAQIRISAINTVFTGLFLLLILPLAHAPLPLAKTLVVLTFIVGLLPVIGNLISNTLIVAVAFTVSLPAAVMSLVFLILIHKFEYFLNARIVGGKIEARMWELLIAMVAMEAAFGIAGVIAAPIFYAYLKRELMDLRLV